MATSFSGGPNYDGSLAVGVRRQRLESISLQLRGRIAWLGGVLWCGGEGAGVLICLNCQQVTVKQFAYLFAARLAF